MAKNQPEPPGQLPELRVKLERVRKGERAVSLDYPDNLGVRTKMGGWPDWIQGDDTPQCESCGSRMAFVAQIDSVEHDNKHNPLRRNCLEDKDYMFGDVGMIYVFWCLGCGQPACTHQCY